MKRVLIAEDEPHVVRLLSRALTRAGYAVEAVSNGADALDRLRVETPDVLITDIEMPRMNGRELCERIEQELPEREFLNLVLTAVTADEHRHWVKVLPNTIFLEKPVSIRKLLGGLETYFEGPAT
ncbi:MAG: response regulator [Gammaproteobacteria bacterium]